MSVADLAGSYGITPTCLACLAVCMCVRACAGKPRKGCFLCSFYLKWPETPVFPLRGQEVEGWLPMQGCPKRHSYVTFSYVKDKQVCLSHLLAKEEVIEMKMPF